MPVTPPGITAAIRRTPPSVAIFIGALALSVAVSWTLSDMRVVPREAAHMAGIFTLATLLWVTEAIPLFATSLLIIALEAILLANPGNWPGLGFENGLSPKWRDIVHTAADPMLLLFFGGFVLSQSAVKTGVDRSVSAYLLRPFGDKPKRLLLGVMLITLLFGMWMSNTATAAMMLALTGPMLAKTPAGDPFRKALPLGVAFAANIGGMTTPIASPPNAVAIGFLNDAGYRVPFLSWMLAAIPLALLLTWVTYRVLLRFFPPAAISIVPERAPAALGRDGVCVVTLFVVTVLLWMSESLHGLPPSLIALFPAVVLTAVGIFDRTDLGRLEWRILILIAGGISLGTGMQASGLDKIVSDLIPTGGDIAFVPMAIIVAATLVVGTFMSNSAIANLFMPVGISVAMASGGAIHPVRMAVSIALAASLSMALPVSTPPNALAYATGEFSIRELARTSLAISAAGIILILLGGGLALRLAGMI